MSSTIPPVQTIADPVADFYDNLGASYESIYGHNEGLAKFIDRALKLLKPASNVLDVGCGTGTPVASTFARHEHQVTGIDIAPSMVALSQKAVPNAYFQVANMLDYTPEGQFDIILNMFSLFNLSREDLENTMSQRWAEWLSPGGLLCIATIALESLNLSRELLDRDGLSVRGLPVRFMGQKFEVNLMSKVFWTRLLDKAGFEVLYREDIPFVPPPESGSDAEIEHFLLARKIR